MAVLLIGVCGGGVSQGAVREERLRPGSEEKKPITVNGRKGQVLLRMGSDHNVQKASCTVVAKKSAHDDVPGGDWPLLPRPPLSRRALAVASGDGGTMVYECPKLFQGVRWYTAEMSQRGWTVAPLSDQAIWVERDGAAYFISQVTRRSAVYLVAVYRSAGMK